MFFCSQYTESLENQLKQKQEQIQTLNDRLYQMKTQMGLEITKLKQQVQDIKEEKRVWDSLTVVYSFACCLMWLKVGYWI